LYLRTRDRDKEKAEEQTRHWEKLQPDERRLQTREQPGATADVQKTTWLIAEAAAGGWNGGSEMEVE
jgi:hypothetical protein